MLRINRLTPAQEARLPEYRDKWLKIGLSTEPLDFEAAKKAVVKIYAAAGLQPPTVYYRMSSPLGCVVLATQLKSAQVGAQVRDQVWAQVSAQVGAQVGVQVGVQVGAQVRDQVGAQVRDQAWAQVGAQVWAQVGAQEYICGYYAVKEFMNLDYDHPAFEYIRMGVMVISVNGKLKVFGKGGKFLGEFDDKAINESEER